MRVLSLCLLLLLISASLVMAQSQQRYFCRDFNSNNDSDRMCSPQDFLDYDLVLCQNMILKGNDRCSDVEFDGSYQLSSQTGQISITLPNVEPMVSAEVEFDESTPLRFEAEGGFSCWITGHDQGFAVLEPERYECPTTNTVIGQSSQSNRFTFFPDRGVQWLNRLTISTPIVCTETFPIFCTGGLIDEIFTFRFGAYFLNSNGTFQLYFGGDFDNGFEGLEIATTFNGMLLQNGQISIPDIDPGLTNVECDPVVIPENEQVATVLVEAICPEVTSCPAPQQQCRMAGVPGPDGTCSYPTADVGTPCGDMTASQCNAADSCDNQGTCQSNFAQAGSPCGDAGSECSSGLCTPVPEPAAVLLYAIALLTLAGLRRARGCTPSPGSLASSLNTR